MNQDARASLTVGAFVLTALVGLGLGILSLSAESGLFQPQYRLIGRFQNVLGLLPGAPVWLGGKEVGRVDRIAFQAIDDERPVLVVMRINEDVQDRIRADSQASIGTIGLLGDSYVEISFGTEGARVLIDGDEIGAADPDNVGALMSEGRAALASISELSSRLNAVVQTFAAKVGADVDPQLSQASGPAGGLPVQLAIAHQPFAFVGGNRSRLTALDPSDPLIHVIGLGEVDAEEQQVFLRQAAGEFENPVSIGGCHHPQLYRRTRRQRDGPGISGRDFFQ